MEYKILYLGFADDMALLNLTLEGLQELIYIAENYLGERSLVIHPLKSAIISLAHPIDQGLIPLNCAGIDIPYSAKNTYLGLQMGNGQNIANEVLEKRAKAQCMGS